MILQILISFITVYLVNCEVIKEKFNWNENYIYEIDVKVHVDICTKGAWCSFKFSNIEYYGFLINNNRILNVSERVICPLEKITLAKTKAYKINSIQFSSTISAVQI